MSGILSMMYVMWDYIWNRPTHFKRKAIVAADERDISNHIVIVTGANRGIGQQTALELAKRGAHVILACRDVEKAEQTRKEILKEFPGGNLEVIELDLGSFESIRKFSKSIHAKFSHVDMLINNAGIYVFDGIYKTTKDGHEQHIGINHFGTFLLTLLLLDLLNRAQGYSRIVTLSSMILQCSTLDVEDLNLQNSNQNMRMAPYANSKQANYLFTRELARRLGKNSKIRTYALCPGAVNVADTSNDSFALSLLHKFTSLFCMLDVKDGSLTTLHCALSNSLENSSGKMYRLLDEWVLPENLSDDEKAKKLWDKSEEIVGEKFKSL